MFPIQPDPARAKIESNAEFLQRLKGRERVGIDQDGRLYTASGFKSLALGFGSLFRSSREELDRTVGQALSICIDQQTRKWQEAPPASPEIVSTFYNTLMRNLRDSGILSEANNELLVQAEYNQIYEALIRQGTPPFVAESIVTIQMSHDPSVPESIKRVIRPELSRAGVNGTYFIKNRRGEKIGIFKPSDEEVSMPNNPRGSTEPYDPRHPKRPGPYQGHEQGVGWIKEITASLISKRAGIGDIPETHRISVPFPERQGSLRLIEKEGSLQQFVQGEALETRPDAEIRRMPVKEIQKIVLLDLLIGNADRNFGNCFVRGRDIDSRLIPIDHGFSLLDSLTSVTPRSEINCHLAGLQQVQSLPDFELAAAVLSLTPDVVDELVSDLRKQGVPFSEKSLKELQVRLMILQVALKDGSYTLDQIVSLIMFTTKEPPFIEKLVKERDIDELIDQWKLAEGDLSKLPIAEAIAGWVQEERERRAKEAAEEE